MMSGRLPLAEQLTLKRVLVICFALHTRLIRVSVAKNVNYNKVCLEHLVVLISN